MKFVLEKRESFAMPVIVPSDVNEGQTVRLQGYSSQVELRMMIGTQNQHISLDVRTQMGSTKWAEMMGLDVP